MADATLEVETRITGQMAQGFTAVERDAKRMASEVEKSMDQVTAAGNRFDRTAATMAQNTTANVGKMRSGVAAGFGAIQTSTVAMERGFLSAADSGRILSTGLLALGGGAVTAGIIALTTIVGSLLGRINAAKAAAQDTSFFGDPETMRQAVALIKQYEDGLARSRAEQEEMRRANPWASMAPQAASASRAAQEAGASFERLGLGSIETFISVRGGAKAATDEMNALIGNANRAKEAIQGVQAVEAERAKLEASARLAQAQAGPDPVKALQARHKSELDAMDLQAASLKERREKLAADMSTLETELARKTKAEDQRQLREKIASTQQEHDAISGIITAGESSRRTTIEAQGLERRNLEGKLAEDRRKKIEEEARKEAELLTRLSEELAVIEAGEDPLAQLDARLAYRLGAVAGNEEAQTLVLQQHVAQRNRIVQDSERQRVEATRQANAAVAASYMMAFRGIAGSVQELAGQSKASFLIQKGLAAAEIVINTARAATAALAPPPLGLGPVAGVPHSFAIGALGGAQLSLVLATAIKGFARGTMNAPGGRVLVGEQGPEMVDIPQGSRIYSNPETEDIIARAAGPQRSREVVRTVTVQAPMTFVFQGPVDDRTVERVGGVVGERLNALGRDLREIEYEGTAT